MAIATTLLEGKVEVNYGNDKKVLQPNEQSIVTEDSSQIQVNQVDASQLVSWVQGNFTFNEQRLSEIVKVLSRWYDVDFVFESFELKDFVFTGVLERTDSCEDILKIIEAAGEGELTFDIDGKTVLIK